MFICGSDGEYWALLLFLAHYRVCGRLCRFMWHYVGFIILAQEVHRVRYVGLIVVASAGYYTFFTSNAYLTCLGWIFLWVIGLHVLYFSFWDSTRIAAVMVDVQKYSTFLFSFTFHFLPFNAGQQKLNTFLDFVEKMTALLITHTCVTHLFAGHLGTYRWVLNQKHG